MTVAERSWMDASCRVAFSAFLHDLGKLAQRAGLFDRDSRREVNQQLYCPWRREGGYFTHLHAADTALAIDLLEPHLPLLRSKEASPFASLGDPDLTDSLINAAAAHHKPRTYLQWCVASADRIASGFERETFEQYNRSADRNDHITARMLVAFEEYGGPRRPVGKARSETELGWRYLLKPLSPEAIVPRQGGRPDAAAAAAEYRALWDALLGREGDGAAGVGLIPKSHRGQWPLWLDHFDSLWLAVAHAIPSAAAFGTRPDISLYDHSKTTAALAVALWRYHAERGDDPESVARAQRDRADWDEPKLLLIQGDFSGIQPFIFGAPAIRQRGAARMLRGRSALVSLLTELAALKLLDTLELPATSQAINAAGRFLIVAPATERTHQRLAVARAELDRWFLERSFGLAGIAVATQEAAPNDLVAQDRFKELDTRLWRSLERAKRQMFGLCDSGAVDAVRTADYGRGACNHDSRLPAEVEVDDLLLNRINADAIALGRALAKPERLLIFRADGAPDHRDTLQCDFFGYRVLPTDAREASGNFGAFAADGRLRRAFDISLPEDSETMLWNGYARRALGAHVPLHRSQPEADLRYDGLDTGERGDLKTFEHLARDDRTLPAGDGKAIGVEALGILKGDIDDLGALFSATLGERRTFAKWAELSRRVNAYFTLRVPWLCRDRFPDVYTVFAGGDDFLFVGPWRTVKRFAIALREDFAEYVAQNREIHFSAGYAMVKPGHPVRQMVQKAEAALEEAKTGGDGRKNAFHLFDQRVPWPEWQRIERSERDLTELAGRFRLSTGYVYGLLELAGMAADRSRPENSAWRSRLFYRTRRIVRDMGGDAGAMQDLIRAFGENGIGQGGGTFSVALLDHLYSVRD